MGAAAVADRTAASRARPVVELEVVIPAHNEESRLPATLRAVVAYLERQPYSSAVVVVDNGSSDRTPELALSSAPSERVPVHLVRCGEKGKGLAVRAGVLGSRAALVGFCDADLATPIESLDTVMPLLRGGARVVIGSRRAEGSSYEVPQPLKRRLGGWGFRTLCRLLISGVPDTQCGFKFFEGALARRLFGRCRTPGFAFDVEVLRLARALGEEIVQVPIAWSDREGSTFQPLRHGVQSVLELAAIAARPSRRQARLLIQPVPN